MAARGDGDGYGDGDGDGDGYGYGYGDDDTKMIEENPLLFIVGERHQKYDGYRMVTRKDIVDTNFQKAMVRFHTRYNGFPIINFPDFEVRVGTPLSVKEGGLLINSRYVENIVNKDKDKFLVSFPKYLEFGENWNVSSFPNLFFYEMARPTLFVLKDFSLSTLNERVVSAYQDIIPSYRTFSLYDLLGYIPIASKTVFDGIYQDSTLPLAIVEPSVNNPRLRTLLDQQSFIEYQPFKVGWYNNEYEGYRKMIRDDITDLRCVEALVESHRKNNGWPLLEPQVNRFLQYPKILCIEHFYILVNNSQLVSFNNTNTYKAIYEDITDVLLKTSDIEQDSDNNYIFGTEKDKDGHLLSANEYQFEMLPIESIFSDYDDLPCIFIHEDFVDTFSAFDAFAQPRGFGTKRHSKNKKTSKKRNKHRNKYRNKHRSK